MINFRASQTGIQVIRQALKKAKRERGWKRDDFNWLLAASRVLNRNYEETGYLAEGISAKTWKNFLSGKAIRAKSFKTYCRILDLDWIQVYDSTEFQEIGLTAATNIPLEDIFVAAVNMHSKGEIGGAYGLLKFYYAQIEVCASRFQPELLGKYYLLFARVQMQRGDLIGEDGAFNLSFVSLRLFLTMGNRLKAAEAYQLIGICFLQIDRIERSIDSYRKGLTLLKDNPKFTYTRMRISHDLGHSLGKAALNDISKSELADEAILLFKESNLFFKTEDPEFHMISTARTAETHMKLGTEPNSQEDLDKLEDVSRYSLMILPYQATFLRINAERYLLAEKFDSAIKFLIAALRLSKREGYTHQVDMIESIIRSNRDIFDNSSPDISDI